MEIFFYKWLTKNQEIGNIPSEFWKKSSDGERVRDTNFGTNVSNKILLNAEKCQGNSFYHFWVIKRNLTGAGGKSTLPTQISVNPVIY